MAFALIAGLGFSQDLRTNVYWIGNNNDAPVSKTETEALDVLADAIDGINSTQADLIYSISQATITQAELTLLGGMNNAALDSLADLTAAELEILDGATVTTAELNLLGGMNNAALDSLADLTAAELDYLDGAAATNATASKVPVYDANGYLVQGFKVFGTLDDSLTTVEYGDGRLHQSVFTLANVEFPAITGGGAEAQGVALGTLPAGDIIVRNVYIDLDLNEDDGNNTADTPDLGIGTTVASGAVATLDGTPAFENIMTGQTMDDCNETDEEFGEARFLLIKAADSHIVYLNVADTWAGAEDNLQATGSVVIEWSFLK